MQPRLWCSATSGPQASRLAGRGSRVSLPAGPQHPFPHGRSPLSPVGAGPTPRPRGSGLTAVGDRALPDAEHRPALILPPVERPGDDRIGGRPRTGAARRRIFVRGSRGGVPDQHMGYAGS